MHLSPQCAYAVAPTLPGQGRVPTAPTHTHAQSYKISPTPRSGQQTSRHVCGAELQSAQEQPDSLGLFRKRSHADDQAEASSSRQSQQDAASAIEQREPGVGQVLHVEEQLTLIDDLDQEAPLGTVLTFSGGAKGILIWRTGTLMSIAVLSDSQASCQTGEQVSCCRTSPQGEMVGPGPTEDTYEAASIAALDGPGGVMDSSTLTSTSQNGKQRLRLFNPQLSMNEREKISESLLTGIKAVDALTPLARGQCLLLTGAQGAGKTSMALDAILGQRSSGLACIYAATAAQQDESAASVQALLERHGAAERTTVIACQPGASLGQRFMACCAAMAVAEEERRKGGHALLVLDDISPLTSVWDVCLRAMTRLLPVGHGEEQVQYADMLVTANEAERRRFFSSLLQRTGKAHRRDRGGSVTSLVVVPGTPALGHSQPKEADIKGYESLSPEYRAKLLAALQRQKGSKGAASEGMSVELVEELMSIADGQVVLQRSPDSGAVTMDFANSISRMGARAHPPAMQALCPPIRLRLAQAADEGKFGVGQGTGLAKGFLGRLQAALQQEPEQPVPLQDQVAMLVALMCGRLDGVDPSHTQTLLAAYIARLHESCPEVMASIGDSATLSPAVHAELDKCLSACLTEQGTSLT